MSTAEIKLDIFRKLDNLENKKIKDFYGLFLNYVNEQNSVEEWHSLSKHQQQGLIEAEEQIKKGKGIAHSKIMAKYQKKLVNA